MNKFLFAIQQLKKKSFCLRPCLLYLCAVMFIFSIPSSYAKYTKDYTYKLNLSSYDEENNVVFIPYTTAEKISYTIPEEGYYLMQLYGSYDNGVYLLGYDYLETGDMIDILFNNDSIPQLICNGFTLNDSLESSSDVTESNLLYPIQEAPEFASNKGYCIFTYIGDTLDNLLNPEFSNISDSFSEEKENNNIVTDESEDNEPFPADDANADTDYNTYEEESSKYTDITEDINIPSDHNIDPNDIQE